MKVAILLVYILVLPSTSIPVNESAILDGDCDELCEYRMAMGINEYEPNDTSYIPNHVHQILHYVCLPLTCSVGIIAILLTIIVLSHRGMATSTNSYLFALGFADLIFLVLLMSRTMDRYTNFNYHFLVYINYAEIFLKICLLISVWLTAILGIERYIAIKKPLHANHLCTVRNARIVIMIIYTLSLLCRFPDFFQFFVIWTYDPTTNSSHPHTEPTQFTHSVWCVTIQPWFIDGLVTAIIPFILLAGLNINLIIEVRRSVSQMRPLTCAYSAPNLITREEIKITGMLISIIIIFFILQFPYIVCVAFLSPAYFNSLKSSDTFILVQDITFLLVSVKVTMHFALYCWFSERFWTSLKSMICFRFCACAKRQPRRKNTTTNDSSAGTGTASHNVKYSHVMSKETTI